MKAKRVKILFVFVLFALLSIGSTSKSNSDTNNEKPREMTAEEKKAAALKKAEESIDLLEKDGFIYVTTHDMDVYQEYLPEFKFYTISVCENVYENSVDLDSISCELEEKLEEEKLEEIKDKEILIYGMVSEEGRIEDCHISAFEDEAELLSHTKEYIERTSTKVDLKEFVHSKIISDATTFKEGCESATWDDLRRNPDLYSNRNIKLDIVYSQVDADGWVFQGTQIANIGGDADKIIAISDNRMVRSPRFVVGDSVTVYGKGDGLTKLTSAGMGSKLSDIWSGDPGMEVPDVDIMYTDDDNYDEWIEIIDSGTNDYHIAR